MKRALMVLTCAALCGFMLRAERALAIDQTLIGVGVGVAQEIVGGAAKALSGSKEKQNNVRVVEPAPEKSAPPAQAQKQETAPQAKPKAATKKKTESSGDSTAKVPNTPMTLEQFAAKADEYKNDKIKTKNFITLCDKALQDAEKEENKQYILEVLFERAQARYNAKDVAGAHADADKAIETDSQSEMGYIAKAIIFELEGDAQDFVEYVTKAAELTPDENKKKAFLQAAKDYPLLVSAISPAQLWTAFNENEVAAEDQYKGKIVSIKGKISEITTSMTGYPQLTFSFGSYGMHQVHCEFPKDARPDIAKLKKRQEVVIAGKCGGMVMKSVFLRSCRVVQ